MEGIDLWPIVRGEKPGREYVTIGWGPEVTFIDERWWCNATIWGANALLYDLTSDAQLTNNLAEEHPEVVSRAVEAFLKDAGGEFPESIRDAPGAPGCTPILESDQ